LISEKVSKTLRSRETNHGKREFDDADISVEGFYTRTIKVGCHWEGGGGEMKKNSRTGRQRWGERVVSYVSLDYMKAAGVKERAWGGRWITNFPFTYIAILKQPDGFNGAAGRAWKRATTQTKKWGGKGSRDNRHVSDRKTRRVKTENPAVWGKAE